MPRKRACKARLHSITFIHTGRREKKWYAKEDGCRHQGRVILKDDLLQFWNGKAHLVRWLRSKGYEVVGYGA